MKKIVIIGGGFAGSIAARKLEHHFDVTLIDTKNYFEFTPSVLRTLVEPQHVKRIEVLHSHYLHQAHLIKDEVQTIDSDHVYTKTEKFPYDYLIIATGSKYHLPIKAENLIMTTRSQDLRTFSKKLLKADSVLIIGGGVVGVELAAEIADHFPEKKLTIIHAQPELLERNPKKARNYALKFLQNKNVEIIFNERVLVFKDHHYKTDKGTLLKPDLAFLCTGIKPNHQLLEKNFSDSLDERNSVLVNPYLQLVNHKNIFAAGDITAIKEEKTA